LAFELIDPASTTFAVREQVDLARVQIGRRVDRAGAARARLDPDVAAVMT